MLIYVIVMLVRIVERAKCVTMSSFVRIGRRLFVNCDIMGICACDILMRFRLFPMLILVSRSGTTTHNKN